MKVEWGTAQLAVLYANSKIDLKKTNPYKIYDFMPHEEEPPVSLEQAMKQWD